MRLQLRALVSLGAALAAGAQAADVVVSSKVQVYADSDATIVVSPHVTGSATFGTGTSVNATYTEDVVSSASVDVRTTASPRIYDRRQEVDFGLGQAVLGGQVSAAYMHARERDYTSNGGSLSFTREFLQRNLGVTARVGFMSNLVGRADDPAYVAPMSDWSGDLAATYTLTPRTIAQVAATVAQSNGMLASPYRKVRVQLGDAVTLLPETEPGSRFRVAGAVGVKQYVGLLVAHLDYRLYADTWSLLSHTAEARLVLDFDALTVRLRYRFYVQNGAYFYQSFYDAPKAYLSADRELSAFTSHLFGVKLEWLPLRSKKSGAVVRVDAKVEGMYFQYPDFPRLPTRWALITQAGVGVDF
ncbi:MAG: DUF3570 domain-containing protein [Myxococcales bacterium]|nr:DUF3570 domain-containing protein [Myxococcales bacterium]